MVYCPNTADESTVPHPLHAKSVRSNEKTRSRSETEGTKEARYADAERRMLRGKRLVISGFIVSVVGMIAYCLTCFTAGMSANLATSLLENSGWLIGSALAVMGTGMLLWLAGSFLYLHGGMDCDPEGPDLYF